MPHCELDTRGGQVPAALTEPYTATTVCMREHPDMPGRCIALAGEVGMAVRCTIYHRRPEACREFAPLTLVGHGDAACNAARRRRGLALLQEL